MGWKEPAPAALPKARQGGSHLPSQPRSPAEASKQSGASMQRPALVPQQEANATEAKI